MSDHKFSTQRMLQLLAENAAVREFVLQYHLSQNPGYRLAMTVDEMPEAVCDFSVFDGMRPCGGGGTRNLRKEMRDGYWLHGKAFPVLLYKLDHDGTTEAWLDGDMKRYRMLLRLSRERSIGGELRQPEAENA